MEEEGREGERRERWLEGEVGGKAEMKGGKEDVVMMREVRRRERNGREREREREKERGTHFDKIDTFPSPQRYPMLGCPWYSPVSPTFQRTLSRGTY